MEVLLATGAYVSWKSIPGTCVKPREHRRALYFVMLPSLSVLRANTHLTEMRLRSLGSGTALQTCFVAIFVISLSIACRQCSLSSLDKASFTVCGAKEHPLSACNGVKSCSSVSALTL